VRLIFPTPNWQGIRRAIWKFSAAGSRNQIFRSAPRWTAEQKPTPETNQDIIDSLVRQEPWVQVSQPEAALVLMAPEWALEREPVPEAVALAWGSALGRALLLWRRRHRSW
jgi:hypothetical protein